MQGYLGIWSGFLAGWKQSYFILHNDVLTYCTDKGGEKEGAIHLKVASIIPILDDPLRICLHTGTNVIQLRAPSVDSRIEWVRVLGQAQSQSINHEVSLQMREMETANGFQNFEQQEKKTRTLEAITSELWKSQAQLEQLLSQILVKVKGSSTASLMCDKLSKLTNRIKYKTNEAVQLLQSYQSNLRLSQKIRNAAAPMSGSNLFINRVNSIRQNNSSLEEYKSFSKDEFRDFSRPKMMPVNNSSLNEYRSMANNDEFKDFSSKHPDSIRHPDSFRMQTDSFRYNNNIDSINQYKSFADPMPNMMSYTSIQAPMARNDSGTPFHSFYQGDPVTPRKNSNMLSNTAAHLGSAVAKCSNPYKNNLILSNPVWSQITGGTISNELSRTQMPITVKPQEVQLLTILKGMVGQDLTRVSLPVIVNQPLSILQKGCEQMYYSGLLDKANSDASPARRLMFVVAFNVSCYSLSINRVRKPFNPLLGETYQYIDAQRKFMYLSQQVSHHPPISAIHCESEQFEFIANTAGSSSFRGSCIKLIPQSTCRVILKKNRQTVTFNRCFSSLNNILVGTKYIDNYGKIEYKLRNSAGKIIAVAFMEFKECGMFGGNQFEVEGSVKDDAGVERYVMTGKWNQSLSALDKYSGNKEVVWAMTHQCEPNYYNYNDLSCNLNFLNRDLLENIATTDTRLRPDQKALQYDLKDLAANEKNRLQELQRTRRKQAEQRNITHQVLWFNKQTNMQTGEQQWISNKQYWVERKDKSWSRSLELY